MTTIEELKLKTIQAQKDIIQFKKECYELFQRSSWYPVCHNDLTKLKCNHCMNCKDKNCNKSQCDRIGRCLCPGTSCICLGRGS